MGFLKRHINRIRRTIISVRIWFLDMRFLLLEYRLEMLEARKWRIGGRIQGLLIKREKLQ